MSKLLFISNKDNNFYNFRKEVILSLLNDGNEVILVCPYGKKIDYFTDKGCRFIDIKIDRRGMNVFRDLLLMKRYVQIFKKEKPSIVLAFTTKTSIYVGLVCRLLQIPTIINNAGLLSYSSSFLKTFIESLYKLSFKKASCLMYQNKEEMKYFNELLKNKVHYRLLPGSGVNIEEFKYTPYPTDDKTIVFNYVSRIERDKGIEEFLESCEIVKRQYPNVIFNIYGDYDEEKYKQRILEMDELGVINYCGVKMDIRPCIAISHAAIHPSYHEGMTNVVLEHSAMGRPCLGSDISGVKEGIVDGETGFLFKVKDVKSLTEAIIKFIQLPHEVKEKMGVAARKKMEIEFDRRIVIKCYSEELQNIIESNISKKQ